MAGRIGPEYQRLIDQIRSKITSGEYPLGKAIPSTAALAELAGMSVPVVRRAVGQLEADGILEGHPGKGVYVRALPEAADAERQDIKVLGQQVAELQDQLRDLAEHLPATQGADIAGELAGLRDAVGRVEVNLIDLYGKMGHDYPHGGRAKAASRHGRTG